MLCVPAELLAFNACRQLLHLLCKDAIQLAACLIHLALQGC
jgi:hypothetical protein